MTSTDMPSHESPKLAAFNLGVVEFDAISAIQDYQFELMKHQKVRPPVLLLCEHPPQLTIGRNGSRSNLVSDDASGTQSTMWVNRAGGCWYSSPGQLAFYVIIDLDAMGLTPTGLVNALKNCLQAVCNAENCATTIDQELLRIGTASGCIGEIGLMIRDGISRFGGILNVNPDLKSFPVMTDGNNRLKYSSMTHHLQRRVSMSSVRESLMRFLTNELGCDSYQIHTDHPLLKRKTVRPHVGIEYR